MTTATDHDIALRDDNMSYVRVSILGSMSGEEVWSINPVFDPTGELEVGIDQAKVDAAALAIANRTIPTSLLALLGPASSMTGARVEIRSDASDALLATSTQGRNTPVAGTGAVRLTAQSAVVLSIRTDTPGASGRGRLYWPAMGLTISNTSRINTPAAATIVGDFKNYLLGMRTDLATAFPTIGFDLAVRSKSTKTTPHAVRVQVGSVPDTQRRRRDHLAESYTSLTFP